MSNEDLLRAYQAAQSFTSDHNIVKYLIDDSLKYFDNLVINNQPHIKLYLQSRGFYNFETLNSKMAGYNKAFLTESKEKIQDDQFITKSTEKYSINEEHDFKEYDNYHIITPNKPGSLLKESNLPPIIQTLICVREGQ
jgi:hypothetical protein